MRDNTSQRAKVFEFARGEPLFLNAFAFSHIAEKNRDAAATWIGVNFKPKLPSGVARFEFHRRLLRQNATATVLENAPVQFQKFRPQFPADKILTASPEKFFGLGINKRKSPFGINGETSVTCVFKNIGHFLGRFL